MAKAATQRPQRPTRDHDARLRRLTMLDALKGWTIPLIALGAALLTWPLSIAGLLENRPAIAIAGAALLVAVYHMGVADFFDERTTRQTVATLLAFSALWAFVVYEPFAAKLNPGPELFAGELPLHGPPATASLGGVARQVRPGRRGTPRREQRAREPLGALPDRHRERRQPDAEPRRRLRREVEPAPLRPARRLDRARDPHRAGAHPDQPDRRRPAALARRPVARRARQGRRATLPRHLSDRALRRARRGADRGRDGDRRLALHRPGGSAADQRSRSGRCSRSPRSGASRRRIRASATSPSTARWGRSPA